MTAPPGLARPPAGPFVGVSAIVVRDRHVLAGRRWGAHGEGTWAFPGGKLDPGEEPAAAAARELLEETGLRAQRVEPVGWTNDLFAEEGLHYVTLHHRIEADGEPRVLEPDKVKEWCWVAWEEFPSPRFAPAATLIASGWTPWGPAGPRTAPAAP